MNAFKKTWLTRVWKDGLALVATFLVVTAVLYGWNMVTGNTDGLEWKETVVMTVIVFMLARISGYRKAASRLFVCRTSPDT